MAKVHCDPNASYNEELESLIDRWGLAQILCQIGGICYDKGEHIRSNWQDTEAAKTWEEDAEMIDSLAGRINN